MGYDFGDLRRRIRESEEAERLGKAKEQNTWEWFWTRWRKYRKCPDDETTAAYADGFLGPVKSFKTWLHIRKCTLCRSEYTALREILKDKPKGRAK